MRLTKAQADALGLTSTDFKGNDLALAEIVTQQYFNWEDAPYPPHVRNRNMLTLRRLAEQLPINLAEEGIV